MTCTITGHAGPITSVAFSPDGTLLASASADRTVRLWAIHAGTGAPVQTLRSHAAAVTSVAFSPDGTLLASASFDGTVKLWAAEPARCCIR